MSLTTIAVDRETHQQLMELKQNDQETFDSLVR